MTSRFSCRTLSSLVLGLAWLAVSHPAWADSAQLDPAILKKVKAATVHLEVDLPNGSKVEGSGFFTDEPGLVITNAHVLGMLDADSRAPTRVAITIRSGETDSRTLPGKLLGVDRGSDLAVLRVEGKDLPAPITVVSAKDLNETDGVYIFGFPLGKRLGKEITVSTSSVSSLRKENGKLKEIQVNGGIHPGNSGGPVINTKGQVVGVSVSTISGTSLNFAIPGDKVHGFLNGTIVSLGADLGYKDGDRIKMAVRVVAVDPLGRLKNITLETWTGEPGTRRRPASATPPAPLPGDSPRETVKVSYQKEAVTSVELSLPLTEDVKKVYWIQPSFVNGTGKKIWYGAWAPTLGTPVERKAVTLVYQPKLNFTQPIEVSSDGTFRLLAAGEEHSLSQNLKLLLTERTAAAKSGAVLPMHLDLRSLVLGMKEDKNPVKADEDTKRDANNTVRFMNADLEMEADGSVGKTKANLGRVPTLSREFADGVGDQMLQALELVAIPLPDGQLQPLQTWKVQRAIALGNTIIAVPAQAEIKYTYLGTRKAGNRDIAFLGVSGRVKGMRGAGLDVGGTVEGGSQVALDTGEALSATMTFKADMDVDLKSGRKAKLYGTMTVHVVRNLPPANPVTPKP